MSYLEARGEFWMIPPMGSRAGQGSQARHPLSTACWHRCGGVSSRPARAVAPVDLYRLISLIYRHGKSNPPTYAGGNGRPALLVAFGASIAGDAGDTVFTGTLACGLVTGLAGGTHGMAIALCGGNTQQDGQGGRARVQVALEGTGLPQRSWHGCTFSSVVQSSSKCPVQPGLHRPETEVAFGRGVCVVRGAEGTVPERGQLSRSCSHCRDGTTAETPFPGQ